MVQLCLSAGMCCPRRGPGRRPCRSVALWGDKGGHSPICCPRTSAILDAIFIRGLKCSSLALIMIVCALCLDVLISLLVVAGGWGGGVGGQGVGGPLPATGDPPPIH